MARPFYHHLHVLFPGTFGQLAQAHQLFDLAYVGAIGQTAGAAGVAQGDRYVIFPADFKNFVKIFVKGVFLAGHAHPGKYQGASPGYNVHFPFVFLNLLNGLARNAAVERHKIHAVLGMEPYHVNKILGGQGSEVTLVMDHSIVDRHCANHSRAFGCQLAPEGDGIAVGGQIHDGMCAQVHGFHDLLHLCLIIFAVPGHAKVYIDFCLQHRAYALRADTGMVSVSADGHFAFGHQGHQLFHGHPLLGGYFL